MQSDITRGKIFTLILTFLIFLVIPFTVHESRQYQETRIRAAAPEAVGENTVVAIINGENITKAQVRVVAQERNVPAEVTNQELKTALETIKERKIIDIIVKGLGLSPDPNKIDLHLLQGLTDDEAKYEALRDQVILKVVKSREAQSIGFFNPPLTRVNELSGEERASASSQLAKGIPALDEAGKNLRAGESILMIGDTILTRSPELNPVLSVNGYILHPLSDAERKIAAQPKIYEFGDSSIDEETRDAIFTANINEVEKITNTRGNRGGIVFKVLSKNDAGVPTYDEWLIQEKAQLVQDLGVL